MRKIILYFVPVSLLFLLMLSAVNCSDSLKKEAAQSDALKGFVPYGDDTIDFSKHPVIKNIGQNLIDLCYDYVLMDSIYPIARNMDTIAQTDFDVLKADAIKIKGDTCRHILAFNMIYAYDSIAHRLIYFYQPVYLKRADHTSPKLQAEYNHFNGTSFYRFVKGSGFQKLAGKDIAKAILFAGAYRRHVTFRHYGKNWFERFKDTSTAAGSVKAAMYSFQEIDSVITENKLSGIILHNAAEYQIVEGKPYLKHIPLIGYENMKDFDTVFYKKFGNLSHLCPPSCEKSSFDLK